MTVLALSLEEIRTLHHPAIGSEHLLLGLLREPNGIAVQIFHDLGIPVDDARAMVINRLGGTADRGTQG